MVTSTARLEGFLWPRCPDAGGWAPGLEYSGGAAPELAPAREIEGAGSVGAGWVINCMGTTNDRGRGSGARPEVAASVFWEGGAGSWPAGARGSGGGHPMTWSQEGPEWPEGPVCPDHR